MAKIMTLVLQDLTLLAITILTRRALEVPQEDRPSAHLTKSLLLTSPAPGHPVPTADDRDL